MANCITFVFIVMCVSIPFVFQLSYPLSVTILSINNKGLLGLCMAQVSSILLNISREPTRSIMIIWVKTELMSEIYSTSLV